MRAMIRKPILKMMVCGFILMICLEISSIHAQQTTRTITDMVGRQIEVLGLVNKISCIHPIPCHMVWMPL
jgi:hypothetical protein